MKNYKKNNSKKIIYVSIVIVVVFLITFFYLKNVSRESKVIHLDDNNIETVENIQETQKQTIQEIEKRLDELDINFDEIINEL